MKVNEPNVSFIRQDNNEEYHIARCARICYGNEELVGHEHQLCELLRKKKHYSMFRHAGVYWIIPYNVGLLIPSKYMSYLDVVRRDGFVYVAGNRQVADETMQDYKQYEINCCTAMHNDVFLEHKMIRLTFVCNTQIAISRELNRKSPNNIAERSTRYCDFNKKIGICFSKPHWFAAHSLYGGALINLLLFGAQCAYRIARSRFGLNLPPQDARYFLPLGVETKVAYTYSVKEWEYIINCRLWDYTGKAHPDAKIIANYINTYLETLGYKIEHYGRES